MAKDLDLDLDGPAGRIEARLTGPGPDLPAAAIAVICHPHPLQGGSMDNKVVWALGRAFEALDIPVLRFNFRGVGRSQGAFDDGRGERKDLVAVADWMKRRWPGASLWLAGFSFGSWISACESAHLGAARLVSVAPPVNLWRFPEPDTVGIPWLIIQGTTDEIAPHDEVRRFAARGNKHLRMISMDSAGHFFHGRLGELSDAVTAWGR